MGPATADFTAQVPKSGTYHLVLNNTFSLFTEKAVVLNLVAKHTE